MLKKDNERSGRTRKKTMKNYKDEECWRRWKRKDEEELSCKISKKCLRSNGIKWRKIWRIQKKRIAKEIKKYTTLYCHDVEELWWTDKSRRIGSRRGRIKENSKGDGISRRIKVVTMEVEKFWITTKNFRGWRIKKKRTEEGNCNHG